MIRRPLRTRVAIRPRANPPIRLPSPIGRLHERVRRPVLVARGGRDLLRQHDARHREHADGELADRALERVRQQDRLVAQELPADAEVGPIEPTPTPGSVSSSPSPATSSSAPSVASPSSVRRARLTIGGTTIVASRTAEPRYVTASNQNASGQRRGEEHDEQAGDRVVDDVRDGLADPHRGVRRQQVALVDDARQDRDPGRPEEDRHRRDQEHQRVGQPDVDQDGDGDEQDQRRPQQVRDDEDLLLVPAVDERPGDGREDQVRDRRHDEGDATAVGESVISNTKAISASWLMRSPNRLMTWPTHSAENEPLSASRMYGCCRMSSSREGRATGTPTSIGHDPDRVEGDRRARRAQSRDTPCRRCLRRACAAARGPMPPRGRGRGRCPACSAASRDRLARREQRPRGLDGDGGGGSLPAGAPATGASRTAVGAPPDGSRAPPRPSIARPSPASIASRDSGHREDGREQEERQARGEEQVADRRDVLSGGIGSGIRSASGPRRRRNSAPRVGGQRDVEDGAERPAQPGRLVGGQPDRHVAAVDHDHERVAGDTDEREREARVAAVLPEREQQEPVGEPEQRQAQLVDEVGTS